MAVYFKHKKEEIILLENGKSVRKSSGTRIVSYAYESYEGVHYDFADEKECFEAWKKIVESFTGEKIKFVATPKPKPKKDEE